MNCLKKAFTLVEILIVVGLIAALCGLAYPAVRQYQASQAQCTMIDDAHRLGAAAQAYFAENATRTVKVDYDRKTGKISGPNSFEMVNGNTIASGYDLPDGITITMNKTESFSLIHPLGGIYTFDDKGELQRSREK